MAQIVTITNPLTGQPAQVDQLDHTAQQIDDAIARALPGGAIDSVLSSKPNPNLLDNWYFGNPVNQRGQTSYTGAGYGIDRWVFDNDSGNATILLTEFGIKFVNSSSATGIGAINQKLPPELYSCLAGKTITISMLGESENPMQVLLLVNGSVYAVNSSRPDENNLRVTTLTATLPETISGLRVYVYGASKSGVGEGYISAAKLELGTQQTLAHQENGVWVLNEIPDYGEQLARCQYYHREGYINAWLPRARDTESPKYSMTVNFPKMRVAPAVTLYDGAGNKITSTPQVAVSYPESFTVASDVETVLFKYVLNADL